MMIWMVWALNALFWVLVPLVILGLIFRFSELFSSFMAGWRGDPVHKLTPKQQALNVQAARKRIRATEKADHDWWTYRFSQLQIETQKSLQEARNAAKLRETPQEKEK